MHSIRHILLAAAAIAAAACAYSAPAHAAAICGNGSYAYAGFDGASATSGVSATIAQAGPLLVRNGHVAGWIGVVDQNTGSAWLQVGLSAMPSETTSSIYYEVAVPGNAPVYHQLETNVTPGVAHRFAVLELRDRPGWWRVWVDGRAVTQPLYLRGSHRRWTAQVLGESWAGTATGTCNSYAYRFDDVSLLRSGKVPPLADPNYAVLLRSHASFVASSVGNTLSY